MTQQERLSTLLDFLMSEIPSYENKEKPTQLSEQKNLLRALMNIRQPRPIPENILEIQDDYLQEEMKGNIISLSTLTPIRPNQYIWQGDITTLGVDAIVNAANSDLLGCFRPGHSCVDNIIHTASGMQLRLACHELMEKQGKPEATGNAKITPAYNLPSKHVIHTVGPIVRDKLELFHKQGLEKCYQSCLELALEHELHSIAFCCISTGVFHFPQDIACDIATETVASFLNKYPNSINVIFNVYKDEDLALYQKKFQ